MFNARSKTKKEGGLVGIQLLTEVRTYRIETTAFEDFFSNDSAIQHRGMMEAMGFRLTHYNKTQDDKDGKWY